MNATKHTPGPWIWGEWVIKDEDREAQKRGEPYWTLEQGFECLARGPYGRKAINPEQILRGDGCECDGVEISIADALLIAAAPALLEALKGLFEHCAMVHKRWGDDSNIKEANAAISAGQAAIALAEGE